VATFLLVAAVGMTQTPTPNVWETLFPQGLLNQAGEPVNVATLQGKYVGIYFAAQWCPNCKVFSPILVPFRNENNKDFEVVFVSSDKNETAQFNYMKEFNMLWTTVKYQSAPVFALKKRFGIKTIPTLIVLSPSGELITRDGRGEVAANPAGALAAWKSAIPQPLPPLPELNDALLPLVDGKRLTTLNERVVNETQAARAIPQKAWVKGTVGNTSFDITFDRTAWTITGKAGDRPVDIRIDHDGKKITGYAHDSGVDLAFTWNTLEIAYDGAAYGTPFWMNIAWPQKMVYGGVSCTLMELSFDLSKGILDGYLGEKMTHLRLDAASGLLTGELFQRPVHLQLTNLDLSDFIQHIYLFMR
jgi:nucleoredoxin